MLIAVKSINGKTVAFRAKDLKGLSETDEKDVRIDFFNLRGDGEYLFTNETIESIVKRINAALISVTLSVPTSE